MTAAVLSRRAALSGLTAVSACARPARPLDRLRVSVSPPTFMPMFRAVAAGFERANPGVTVELAPSPSYVGVMQRDFRLSLVGDEFDVSHVALNYVRFYAERGLALDLGPRIAADPTPLTQHPTIGRVAGVIRALPFAVSAPVSYFNPDLIRRAGRDPDALLAAGWPALLDAAAAVSRLGGPTSGLFFDYTGDSALGWQMLVLGQGGRMMTPDERRIAFDGPEGLWAARLLAAMRRAGQLDISRENARMAFTAGQVGCFQNTSASIARFQKAATGFRLSVAPLPIAPGLGRRPAAGNALVIPTRDPRRQDLAWRYVRFAAGPIGQTIMARESGYLSLNHAAVADPALLGGLIAARPFMPAIYRQLDTLDAWYAFPGPRSEDIAQGVMDQMRDILRGRASPEVALAAMSATATRLLPAARPV